MTFDRMAKLAKLGFAFDPREWRKNQKSPNPLTDYELLARLIPKQYLCHGPGGHILLRMLNNDRTDSKHKYLVYNAWSNNFEAEKEVSFSNNFVAMRRNAAAPIIDPSLFAIASNTDAGRGSTDGGDFSSFSCGIAPDIAHCQPRPPAGINHMIAVGSSCANSIATNNMHNDRWDQQPCFPSDMQDSRLLQSLNQAMVQLQHQRR